MILSPKTLSSSSSSSSFLISISISMSTSSSSASPESLRRSRILSSKLYFDVPPSKVPLIYSSAYNISFLGMEKLHPFDSSKWGRICQFLISEGVLDKSCIVEPEEASKEDLLVVHPEAYLDSLKNSLTVAKIVEVPPVAMLPNCIIQRKILEPFQKQVGGSVLAAKLAIERGWAINVGGGFHHCSANKGGGFCAYADISLCVHFALVRLNISRISIIDLDAHQGNGHEIDFAKDRRVYILDMYNFEVYPLDLTARRYIDQKVEIASGTETDVYLKKLDDALEEYYVKTGSGAVSVAVYGDQDKPALVTYPDLALNYASCFQGLFLCPEALSLLVHNFCIYHISPPGHEWGAAGITHDISAPSVDDLADQILDVLDYFRLGEVMCMGVTAGAYILTLFATKYKQRVLGLILISPFCRAPTWTEWLYNKVMSNLLYFYGMCSVVKEMLLKRYFSKELRGNSFVPESDVVLACRKWLDDRESINVMHLLEATNRRPDLSEGLKKLRCRSLIFVGENSSFHSEAVHMATKLDRRFSALVEVQACGSLVTEERPHAMLIPLEYFIMGYGFYRQSHMSVSPRSPLSPSCISPELLSPESMGLKLKPIKTRISLEV